MRAVPRGAVPLAVVEASAEFTVHVELGVPEMGGRVGRVGRSALEGWLAAPGLFRVAGSSGCTSERVRLLWLGWARCG